MTYAFVQDIASTWEHYERFAAATIDPSRTSLILHVAGPTEEGFRIIEVWETERAWQRFQAERLKPAIAALGGPARPRQTFRDLHVAHVVLGPRRDAMSRTHDMHKPHPPANERHLT